MSTRKTLVAAVAAGAAALTAVGAVSAAPATTAPDATVNLRLVVTDTSAAFNGRPQWSKLMEPPRGTYGRMIIHNTGTKPHTFVVTGLQRRTAATVKPGKKVIIVGDFLRRGDFKWSVDAGSTGGGLLRIF